MKPRLYVLLFLALCGCAMCTKTKRTTNIFTLKGNFSGKDADTIFLSYLDTNGKRMYQSAKINKGLFSFRGYINAPVQADLMSNIKVNPIPRDDVSNGTEIFLSPGDMTVVLHENDFEHAKIKGSAMQDEWNDLQKTYQPIYRVMDSLYSKMFALERAGNTPKNHVAHVAIVRELDKYQLDRDKIDYHYISTHPRSYLSAFLLKNFADGEMRLDSIEMFYNPFSDTIKKSVSGRAIRRIIENRKIASVGNITRIPEGVNSDGSRFNPRSFKIDNYAILYFWAGWANDNSRLKSIYNKYQAHDLQILAISLEDLKETWLDSIKKNNISNWHNIHVGLVANIDTFYNIRELAPSLLLLVDKNRKIIGRYRGWNPQYKFEYGEGDINDLDKKLAKVFSKN